MKVSVFGCGSWGTALAQQMARRGLDVLAWALEPEVVEGINSSHRNPVFLSDLELHPSLRTSTDLEEVGHHSNTWVWVVPVQFSRSVMEGLIGCMRSDVVMVSSSKGIETSTLKRMDEQAFDVLDLPQSRFCALSGPTFAREVIQGQPSLAVLACPDLEVATRLQEAFSDQHLRFYAARDLVGVELAGALKNPIAIAAGVIDGMGLGANTQAALITRGLHEITRLGVAVGADATTFRGLAGMGDLVLTCTGGLSRNRSVGLRLGRGESLDEILGSMREVVEGVRTTPAAVELAHRHKVEMPIAEGVARLLSGETNPRDLTYELMGRPLQQEAKL
ncbi:MAG: NAD(P)-dependent glycerol-3-phosphate dehydrogenase [Thermoanaerobaculales bacterium]|nr:NAD(P)-dependent glycerol-3-phosphate dehydrogenase [Thermoanaerobaculales bacterium]